MPKCESTTTACLITRLGEVSPRVGASYYWEGGGLMFRGSYDRPFFRRRRSTTCCCSSSVQAQTNCIDVQRVAQHGPFLNHADFYEVGVRKAFGDRFRLDVNHYWRDLLRTATMMICFNTSLSFPISFKSSEIEGTGLRLEMPRCKGVSSFITLFKHARNSYLSCHGWTVCCRW